MVTHTRNWSSAFNPSKCTHTAVSSEHTHCEPAPGAVGSHCSSARGAIGGSVPCSRAPQSWYWRWRECCSFTIPTFNPCRTWDSNPQPLDYKSHSLTIRPRLPSVKGRWPPSDMTCLKGTLVELAKHCCLFKHSAQQQCLNQWDEFGGRATWFSDQRWKELFRKTIWKPISVL